VLYMDYWYALRRVKKCDIDLSLKTKNTRCGEPNIFQKWVKRVLFRTFADLALSFPSHCRIILGVQRAL